MTSDGERRSRSTTWRASKAKERCTSGIEDGRVADVALKIFEPPRLFEALAARPAAAEAPDITARICGICPVAYQMSAVPRDGGRVRRDVGGQLRALRRLLYCGEWIESHALHIYMLHAPDFLGVRRRHRDRQRDPAMVRARAPAEEGRQRHRWRAWRPRDPSDQRARRRVLPRARPAPSCAPLRRAPRSRARDLALETVRWVAGFAVSRLERDYEFVALRHPDEYPMCEGRIVSTAGLDIAAREFDAHFVEEHAAHSNALHCRLQRARRVPGGAAGAVPAQLRPAVALAQQAAREAGLGGGCSNPFRASSCAPSKSSTRAMKRCA